MVTQLISSNDASSCRHACRKSATALIILALFLTGMLVWPSSGAEQVPSDGAVKDVLDGVEKNIGKEPKYVSSPRYALLVFGAKADSQVWIVEDGKLLYVDRNGNGDLTDDGPPIVPTNFKGWKTVDGSARYQFDYGLDEITPGGSRHTELRLLR
jgi:hypothetical protein